MNDKKWTPSDLAVKSRSGFVSLVKRSFLINIMQVVSSITLAKFLSQSDFAIFGILNGWIISLIYFTDFGIGDHLSQKGSEYTTEDLSFYFFVRLILTGVATAVFFLIMPTLLEHYKIELIYRNYLYLLPLLLPLDVIAAATKVKLDLELKFNKISTVDVVSSVILYVVQISSAIAGLKAWAFFLGLFAKKLITSLLTLKFASPLPLPAFKNKEQFSHLKNGFFFHINTLIVAVNTVVLPLILTAYLDNHFIGLIFWMEGLVKLAFIISTNYNQVIFLTLSNLKHDLEAYKNMAKLAINNVLTLLALVYGLGAVASPKIVDIIFGAKWAEAKAYFPWVCLYMYLFSVRYLSHSIHYSLGRPKLRIANETFHILLTYILVFSFVKTIGFDGYFYGIALANLIGLLFTVLITRQWLGIQSLYRFFTVSIASAAPFFIIQRVATIKDNLILSVLSFGTIFLLILLVLDKSAIADVKKSILKVFRKS